MIHDLCVIMLTAGITSLLFKLIRQPVVLGYIVAGIMAGPHLLGGSWIHNSESVDTWGQIGVLFVLFAMGLEFSFKKLINMGSTVVVAAMVIVTGMMTLGYLTGQLMGWGNMDSLFLGGMICMSSTTIVFKAIEDMGLSKHHFVGVTFGILIVEDLFAVVLMVLLSSIAVKRSFEGGEMLLQLGKLVSYLLIWFIVGIAVIPTFLRGFRKYLNDETLTIISIGLCLGMVLLAVDVGFSSALGAFVMGSVLAETLEAERIEHLVKPVKDIFGAIFFVSVGMMINPATLAHYWLPILIITLLVIFGQILFGSLGTLISGQSLRVSLQTGFSLVQIGEFAFIIASLGQQLNVTADFLYPVVVAVSVVTTFLTPYIMRLAIPTLGFIERHASPGLKLFLENYAKNKNTPAPKGTWSIFLRRVVVNMFVYGVITFFIYLFSFSFLLPLLAKMPFYETHPMLLHAVFIIIVLSVSSPFIYKMGRNYNNSAEARELWHSGNIQKGLLVGVFILRILVCMMFVGYAIGKVFDFKWGVIACISAFIVIVLLVSRKVKHHSAMLEGSFQRNLTAREVSKEQKRAFKKSTVNSLLNYDIHISTFKIPNNSSFCGKSLKELHVRNESGASIVSIIRGGMYIFIPGGDEAVYPADELIVAGSDAQVDSFQKMLDKSVGNSERQTAYGNVNKNEVGLEHYNVGEGSLLAGKSIKNSGMREKARCIIMGVEREGQFIMNPDPNLIIEINDTLILAGEKTALDNFLSTEI